MRAIQWAAAMCAMVWAAPASAQQIEVLIDGPSAQELGLDAGTLEADLTQGIGDQLRLLDQEDFLRTMANAASISTRGMGVDYASDIKTVVVGFSGGTGVSQAEGSLSRGDALLPQSGFSAQLSLMAGLNLGLGASNEKAFSKRFRIYANGLALSGSAGDGFDASFANVGGHLQFKLINPVNAKVAKWGGLDVTSGVQMTRYTLSLAGETPVETPSDPATLTWDADGTYDVEVDATTIPIEVSTNVRIVFITAFGGLGYDIIDAAAKSEAGLEGPIEASAPGPQGEQTSQLGTARVSLSDRSLADPSFGRVFIGGQLNIFMVKVYGQVNAGFNQTFGGHAGLRVAL